MIHKYYLTGVNEARALAAMGDWADWAAYIKVGQVLLRRRSRDDWPYEIIPRLACLEPAAFVSLAATPFALDTCMIKIIR